jgi:Domain of unknown function (DUF5666)
MRGTGFVRLLSAGLAIALAAAGCGGKGSVTGPDEGKPSGSAVLQGGIVGAGFSASSTGFLHALASGSGMRVSVVGTALSTEADEEGRFVMSGLPPGSVTLRFEGNGVDAQLAVSGLVDGQVLSIEVHVSGSSAELGGSPTCTPSAETHFSGSLESIVGTRLVVTGRTVDASEVRKVWRGDRRIELADLLVGEKVQVWGTLRGDGVVVADEVVALTTQGASGEMTWVTFSGSIESVRASSLGLHFDSNGPYPTLIVKGVTVTTSADTKLRGSDGSTLAPGDIKVGQHAEVEGWKRTDGVVKAQKLTLDGAGTGSSGWVSFKGRVESVVALDAASGVHSSCLLKMKVAGRSVQTDGSTVFKWSDGSSLDPYAIVTGDQARIEGWNQPEGYVLAESVVITVR